MNKFAELFSFGEPNDPFRSDSQDLLSFLISAVLLISILYFFHRWMTRHERQEEREIAAEETRRLQRKD